MNITVKKVRMMNWKWVLLFILLLFLVIFATQNYEIVEITFLFWSFRTSRSIIIFSTLLVGIFIGWTITLMSKNTKK
ncbi:LapA family protein [Candidatus Latescibacterota bacterium]